ncbi:proton-coupled folate transporter-like [Saccostrea echinata]|uniref:proton-coupled folate transporter-like n=1 Tax=Saccostrea echinata TaxID=191078 RepID=UPI002A7EC857|nr:proton-coupled folate transporter-like [Saccostrea echinata]
MTTRSENVLEKDVNLRQRDSCEAPFDDNDNVETAPLLGNSSDIPQEDEVAIQKGRRLFLFRCFVLFSGVFLLVVAFTILQLGVLNQYVYFAYHKKYFPNISYNSKEMQKSYCNTSVNASTGTEEEIRNKIQVLASQFMIYTSLALFIPPIFGVFFLSTLSDTYGRKPFIVIPIFGALIRSALFVVGIHYELDLYWFIVFLLVEGLTGGLYCQITVSLSYVADITKSGDKRILLLVILEIIAGFGGLLGTLSSGYLIQAFGFEVPSFISTLCILLSLLLFGFFLPESLPPEFKSRSKNINICEKLKGVWEFYTSDKYGKGTQWRYVFSLLILICVELGVLGRSNVETLYQLNRPFCWSSVLLGWFMGIRIVSSYILGAVLIRILQCCVSVEFIALVGASSHMAAFILEAFAEESFELFLVPVVGFGSAMIAPIMKGFMSKMAPADKQGTLFAGVGMADTFCSIVGTTLSNAVYSATVADMRGFVFLMFAGISAVAVILIIVLWIAGRVGGSTTLGYQEEAEIIIKTEED